MERIYIYKITFEEMPHWYWGIHWEKKINDNYLGSPVTNKRFWEWYTPIKTIYQEFEPTSEGWELARKLEEKIIILDLKKFLCLNERVGLALSPEAKRKGVQLSHAKRNSSGKSIRVLEHNEKMHRSKNEEGKSLHAMKMKNAAQAEKDENGKSVHAKKMSAAVHNKKNSDGKSLHAIKAGKAGKGLIPWNNGETNTKSRECPGEGWVKGYVSLKS